MPTNNPYYIAKKLTDLDLASTKAWLGTTTSQQAEIKGQWVARELYHLDGGLIGYERIFYSHDNESKKYPKRPTYKHGYTGDKTPAFTPVGCTFEDIAKQKTIFIVGGYADAITVYNAWGKLTPVLGIQGENNTSKLVQQLSIKYPSMRVIVALDGDATGKRESIRTGKEWITPDRGDWNDLYLSDGLESVFDQLLLIQKPLPSFDENQLWKLTRPAYTPEIWSEFKELTDPVQVASHAMMMCLVHAKDIPTRWKNEQAFIDTLLRHNHLITPATTDNLKSIMGRNIREIKNMSLSLNTLTGNDKHRHNYKRIRSLTEIPTLGNGVHCLSAPHGVGKTEVTGIPFFRQSKGHALFICHLRSLVADAHERINDAQTFPVAHYETVKQEIRDVKAYGNLSGSDAVQHVNHNAIACCINSIVSEIEDWTAKTDTLFIDEISQALSVVALADYKGFNHINVYDRLKSIVRNAKRVLVMDADLDNSVISFLEQCRPNERFNIYEMPRQSTDYQCEWIYGKKESTSAEAIAMMRINAMLSDNKKLIIPTDARERSISIAAFIKTAFPNKKMLVINRDTIAKAETKTDVLNFLREPNKYATLYDVVIHSPTLRSGVSITVDHFDMCIAVFGGRTISPQDAIQMMRRARPVKHFLVCVDEQAAISAFTDAQTIADAQQSLDLKQNIDSFVPTALSDFDIFRNEQEVKKNKGRVLFAPALYHMLDSYRFNVVNDNHRELVFSPLIEIRKQKRDEFRAMVMESPVLSQYEYTELKNSNSLSIEDEAAIEAFNIRECLCITKITKEVMTLWNEGRVKKELCFLDALINDKQMPVNKNMPLSLRKFDDVKLGAIRDVLALTSLDVTAQGTTGEITKEQELSIKNHIWLNRITYAYMKLIPAKYADPKAKEFKDVKKVVRPLLEKAAIHLSGQRKRNKDSSKADNRERVLCANAKKMEFITGVIDRQNCPTSAYSLKKNYQSGTKTAAVNAPTIAEQHHEYSDDFVTDEMLSVLSKLKGSSFWDSERVAEDNEFINAYNWKAIRANLPRTAFWSIAQRAAH